MTVTLRADEIDVTRAPSRSPRYLKAPSHSVPVASERGTGQWPLSLVPEASGKAGQSG